MRRHGLELLEVLAVLTHGVLEGAHPVLHLGAGGCLKVPHPSVLVPHLRHRQREEEEGIRRGHKKRAEEEGIRRGHKKRAYEEGRRRGQKKRAEEEGRRRGQRKRA